MAKALVPIRGKSLAPRVVNAQVEVLPKAGPLAVREPQVQTARQTGPLTVQKPGSKSVIVSNTTPGQREPQGSGQIWAANNGVTARGLVKVVDALRIAEQFGAPVAEAEAAIRPLILSMGNKRKVQRLADGGVIQRRLRGTGFDGANNKGFAKGRGSRSKQTSGTAGGGTPDDPYSYVTKKRSSAAMPGQTVGGSKATAALPAGKASPLSIEDGKKPLMLGEGGKQQLALIPDRAKLDKALAARPAPSAPSFKDAPGEVGGAWEKVKGLPVVGPIAELGTGAVRKIAAGALHDIVNPRKVAESQKAKLSDVTGALRRGDFKAAMNLAMAPASKWETPSAQLSAMEKIEKWLSK